MATISDKPWADITQADYPDAGSYCDACLINQNTGARDTWTKDACKLPVKEPGGAVNRNAAHAVAGVLAGARGGVGASDAEQQKAAAALVGIYQQLKEDPPASLTKLAGQGVDSNIRRRAAS